MSRSDSVYYLPLVGEVAEWFIALGLKPSRHLRRSRGFESHPLHSYQQLACKKALVYHWYTVLGGSILFEPCLCTFL